MNDSRESVQCYQVLPLKMLAAISYSRSRFFTAEGHINDVQSLICGSPAYSNFLDALGRIRKLSQEVQQADYTIFEYSDEDFNTLFTRIRPAARILLVIFMAIALRYMEGFNHPILYIPVMCLVVFSKKITPHEYFLMAALAAHSHRLNMDFLTIRSESERRYAVAIDSIKKVVNRGLDRLTPTENNASELIAPIQKLILKLNRSQRHGEMIKTLKDIEVNIRKFIFDKSPTTEEIPSLEDVPSSNPSRLPQ